MNAEQNRYLTRILASVIKPKQLSRQKYFPSRNIIPGRNTQIMSTISQVVLQDTRKRHRLSSHGAKRVLANR